MLYKCHARLMIPFNYSQMATSPLQSEGQPSCTSKLKSQISIWMSTAIFRVKCTAINGPILANRCHSHSSSATLQKLGPRGLFKMEALKETGM